MVAPATIDEAISQRQSTVPAFSSRARVSRLSAVKQPKAQTTAASTTSTILCSLVMQFRTFIMKRFQQHSGERSVNKLGFTPEWPRKFDVPGHGNDGRSTDYCQTRSFPVF